MKFTLRKPCNNCPFLRSQGFLHPERAKEIANYALTDNVTFTCHKQITGEEILDENENAIGYTPGREDIHCAGALILSEKHGRPNQMHQIAQRLGIYDPTQLDMNADIYETADEMMQGHCR